MAHEDIDRRQTGGHSKDADVLQKLQAALVARFGTEQLTYALTRRVPPKGRGV